MIQALLVRVEYFPGPSTYILLSIGIALGILALLRLRSHRKRIPADTKAAPKPDWQRVTTSQPRISDHSFVPWKFGHDQCDFHTGSFDYCPGTREQHALATEGQAAEATTEAPGIDTPADTQPADRPVPEYAG